MKYTFPLTRKMAFAPKFFETDDLLDGQDKTLVFNDGKIATVKITHIFELDGKTDRLAPELCISDHGNAVVTDGNEWFQMAYILTSRKA